MMWKWPALSLTSPDSSIVTFSAVIETVTPLAAVSPSAGVSKATLVSLLYSIGASPSPELSPSSPFPLDWQPASGTAVALAVSAAKAHLVRPSRM